MEINKISNFDIASFNAGYERGRQEVTDNAYRRGYEAALNAMREHARQIEIEYDEFLKEENLK